MAGFLSDLFGGALSGDNHFDPATRFTRFIDEKADPLYWITGGDSGFYGKAKNKLFDLQDLGADKANEYLSDVVTPIDNAISPLDPLTQTSFGQGLHNWVNNKPASALAAALTGAGFAGAAGGAGAAGSGLGADGTFSGALGASATTPSFGAAIPSVGGSTTAGFGSAVPSIGGTTTASFAPGAASGGIDYTKLASQFLQKQGQQTANQGAPQRYHSNLINDQPAFVQTPADFNPMGNKGMNSDNATIQLLIKALQAKNG